MNTTLNKLLKTKEQKIQTVTKKKKTEIKVKGPTGIIKKLYLESFFVNSKTLNDVEKRMKALKFNYGDDSRRNALDRATFLTKKGKKGKYSYIQKYPSK